jgi:hypothetical protein
MAIPINQEKWPPAGDTHARRWIARVTSVGLPVTVRHVAILAPGENLTEDPETWQLTWDEWVAGHESLYGLSLDGRPVAEVDELRTAWRRIRQMANGNAPFEEDSVRKAFAGALRVLRTIAAEEAD